jgi:predicted nucleic acid-binding protein
MFVVDTNILLYAANSDCPEHSACLDSLQRSRSQKGAWYATWNILYGFVRARFSNQMVVCVEAEHAGS